MPLQCRNFQLGQPASRKVFQGSSDTSSMCNQKNAMLAGHYISMACLNLRVHTSTVIQ